MLPIIELLLGGGTLGGVAYLISKIRCILLPQNDHDPVVIVGSHEGADLVIITAKKEHHLC